MRETKPARVKLKDIVDELEMQFDERPSFVDLDTGEVTNVSLELLREAEDSEDDEEPGLLELQDDEWEMAKKIAGSTNFRRLPSKYDAHEWEIMREFSESVESDRIRAELLPAIHGSGAFRYFKDTLRRHRIESAWHEFRTEALRQIAIDWCQRNKIPWE